MAATRAHTTSHPLRVATTVLGVIYQRRTKRPVWKTGPQARRPQSAKKKSRGPLLSGPDAEHLGATGWARARGGRLPVLHGDLLRILDLPLASALHTIGFHTRTSHNYGRDILA